MIDPSCSHDQQVALSQAIYKGAEIADAALAAISDRAQSRLFEFFFKSGDRQFVKNAFTQFKTWRNRQGPPVVFHCRDYQNFCDDDLGAYALFDRSYPATLTTIPDKTHFAICPRFFAQPAAPDPCDKSYLEPIQTYPNGTYKFDQASGILHETFHVPYVAGPAIQFIDDIDKTIDLLHALTDLKAFGYDVSHLPAAAQVIFQPTRSAYSYSAFAIWAWIQSKQQAACPNNCPLWNVLTDYQSKDRGELRKLLGESSQSLDLEVTIGSAPDVAFCDPGCLNNLTLPTSNSSYQDFSEDNVEWTVVNGVENQVVTPPLTRGNGTLQSLAYSGTLVASGNGN